MQKHPFTIAISGKGGTGKTTVSSLLIRSFIDLGEVPVLAVDADPNANLHEALGVPVHETLGCMREEAFTRQIPRGMNLDPSGTFLYAGNQNSDTIAVFRVNAANGKLTLNELVHTPVPVDIEFGAPV